MRMVSLDFPFKNSLQYRPDKFHHKLRAIQHVHFKFNVNFKEVDAKIKARVIKAKV